MNRAERRAAAAREGSKPKTIAREVAVHEAGHAIARLLTAREFGYPAAKCIVRIDVGPAPATQPSISADGSATSRVQATSFGLMFSSEISTFLESYFPTGISGYGLASPSERQAAFKAARHRGVAVDTWLEARMLIDVFGAAAEAKLLNKDAVEIWNGPEAEGDFREAVFAATMAGLKNHEIREKLSTALERAVSLIEKPHVWRAVQAVADLLPSRGSVAGRKIYHAASRALGSALLD